MVTLVQLGRTLARPAGLIVRAGARRSVRRAVGLALIVVTVRVLAGVWTAAVLGAVVVTVGLLVAWAAVERRVTERVRARPVVERRVTERVRARPVVVERGPRGSGRLDGEHVAFARGLAGLAAWYLAECERQEREALR